MDQLLDVRGQVAGDHVGQGDLLEHQAQTGADSDPDLLEVLGGPVVVGGLGPEAAHLGERTVEGTDDVGDGDGVGVSGQAVAALGASLAGDDPGAAEVGQYRPRKRGGRPCSPARNSAVCGVPAAARASSARMP